MVDIRGLVSDKCENVAEDFRRFVLVILSIHLVVGWRILGGIINFHLAGLQRLKSLRYCFELYAKG
jgi:hypothetical protein